MPLVGEGRCGFCLEQGPIAGGSVLAACEYGFPVRELVHQLKYGGRLYLASALGELLAEAVVQRGAGRPQALLGVPLHSRRLAQRGFNQAVELARAAGKRLAIPVIEDACRRGRDTPPQAGIGNWGERHRNVRGAFQCTSYPGDHVAVVDDVMTTGSTVREMVKTLLGAGVRRVDVWVVCRAMLNPPAR
jgi:ComF family protein